MEIGLIYSKDDPRQVMTRDFVHKFVRDYGLLANVVEKEKAVKSPVVIIDGYTLKEKRKEPRPESNGMFPANDDVARELEKHLWCL